VLVSIPCDTVKLATSADLPPSIYDKGEEVVASAEIDALVNQALAMGSQASLRASVADVRLRTTALQSHRGVVGGGDRRAAARRGLLVARRGSHRSRGPRAQPRAERIAQRSPSHADAHGVQPARVGERLGNPLGLGPSIVAFAFGRDDGFYYRASGLELSRAPGSAGALNLTWSLFAEQERNAPQRTTFSLARVVSGRSSSRTSRRRRRSTRERARASCSRSAKDPQGFRLFNDLRLEAAHGDTGTYGRVALDVTASHGVGNGAVALTLAGGTSVGILPIQRNWFLGGTQTVRGLRPGTGVGDAFWMARAEAGYGFQAVRPVLFGDIGWAGDRTQWREIGTPLAGVGAGFLDPRRAGEVRRRPRAAAGGSEGMEGGDVPGGEVLTATEVPGTTVVACTRYRSAGSRNLARDHDPDSER
jgi:hypothetical protein